jgi:hypothetical protein
MRCTKMDGLGNDHIYINCSNELVGNPIEPAQIVCNPIEISIYAPRIYQVASWI